MDEIIEKAAELHKLLVAVPENDVKSEVRRVLSDMRTALLDGYNLLKAEFPKPPKAPESPSLFDQLTTTVTTTAA